MAQNANSNGIGGSALFNLLQKANEHQFNSTAFDASNSTVANSANNISNNNTPVSKTGFAGLAANAAAASSAALNAAIGSFSPAVQSTLLQNQSKIIKGNSKYQYDMFERLQFGTPLNNATNAGISKANLTTGRPNIDNKVIINYKNYVTLSKLDPNNSADRTFVNKININSKFVKNGITYKDPSIETIVEELKTYPTTKISYADFLYCKKLGAYPNNRLVILRRFFQPVDDNLYDSPYANNQQNPLSVMVTWFDDFPFTIRYGEEWSEHTTGILEEFSNTISSLTPNAIKKNPFISSIAGSFKDATSISNSSSDISSPWLKTLWYQFIDNLYANNSNSIPPNFKNVLTEANPNKIRQAVIKKGLSFSIEINLSFTYVMRYINGIDPHVAMHNIIANAVRMGTSTSVTIFPRTTQSIPQFVQDLNQGKVIDALRVIYDNVSTYLNGLFTKAKQAIKNTSTKDIRTALDDTSLDDIFQKVNTDSYSRMLFSLYRFQLTAAVQADLGIPSGSWHVSVGNPFNPVASIGDLVINPGGAMSMKFNNELSYDDQPTEITFTIALKNARPRGAQEIEQIFNAGRGRIYVYPQLEDDPDLYLSDTNPTMGSVQSNNATVSSNVTQNVKPQ